MRVKQCQHELNSTQLSVTFRDLKSNLRVNDRALTSRIFERVLREFLIFDVQLRPLNLREEEMLFDSKSLEIRTLHCKQNWCTLT
jgi:hypothetical protein